MTSAAASVAANNQPVVSIIVVSFNTRDMTLACLRSIAKQTGDTAHEVIVIDNASTDGSAEAIRASGLNVRLIESATNLGFARANNVAIREARGDYILLLNPDTVVLDRAVTRLVAFARCCPDARIWGGRTEFADGRLNPGSCFGRQTLWRLFCRATGLTAIFRNTEVFNGEGIGGWARDTARRVDIVCGCFLLIKRNFWNELGGFDPAFFMYGEEADLCLRATAKGAAPMITPDASIIHYAGASETVREDKMVRLLSAKAMLIDRHFPPATRGIGKVLLAAWPLTRAIALMTRVAATGKPTHSQAARCWHNIWLRRREWIGGYRTSDTSTEPGLAATASVR